MNPKFIPLTRHEMFFGITAKTNLSSGETLNSTGLISKVASSPINQTSISPTPNVSINTDMIAQQQIDFALTDILWKHKWKIGIGIAVGLIIYYSTYEDEDRNETR